MDADHAQPSTRRSAADLGRARGKNRRRGRIGSMAIRRLAVYTPASALKSVVYLRIRAFALVNGIALPRATHHSRSRAFRAALLARSRAFRAALLGSLLLLALGWAGPGLGAWADAQLTTDTMPVSQIKPGMKGYGLSVFRGEQPERFEVDVIDVLHNFRPNQDLILVNTHHPILEHAKTVGGMSGSPIYLEGKMIGAYAYGWQFGSDPIAGVTPIASMLAEINRPLDPRIWKSLGTLPALLGAREPPNKDAGPRAERAGVRSTERGYDAFAALREHAERVGLAQTPAESHSALIPTATPLMVSGMTESALRVLGQQLERFGIVPLEAGGASGSAARPAADGGKPLANTARFIDGGSIGVQLIRGDVNATAIGTVTHVTGDRLVAFGHPMMNAGQVGLATCTARVLHVLASEQRSFKIAEAITPLGTLIHDRQAAIVIDQKLKADMVPVTVHIHGAPAAPHTEWHMEVANSRLLTPSLTFSAAFSALSATAADNVDTVFKIKSKVAIDGHGEIETEDVGYTPGGGGDPMTLARLRLFAVLGAAYGNPFEDARVSNIDIDITIDFQRDVVTIVDAMAASEDVDPGKSVNVYVTLRHFDAQEEVKIVPVQIPWSAAGESVEIAVEAGDDVHLDEPKAASLDDMLNAVRHGYSGTSLVLSTKLPSQGVKLRGQLVRALPGSALDTLQPVNEADRGATFSSFQRSELPIGRVLTGSAKIKLNVRQEPLR